MKIILDNIEHSVSHLTVREIGNANTAEGLIGINQTFSGKLFVLFNDRFCETQVGKSNLSAAPASGGIEVAFDFFTFFIIIRIITLIYAKVISDDLLHFLDDVPIQRI